MTQREPYRPLAARRRDARQKEYAAHLQAQKERRAMRTLVICIDDVGQDLFTYAALGQLSSESITPIFWTSPVCSAARACYYTRQHSFRHGIGSIVRHSDAHELDPAYVRLPDGKHVHLGKWHLSGGEHPEVLSHPIRCGIHHFDGHLHNVRSGAQQSYWSWPRYRIDGEGAAGLQETEYLTTAMTQAAIAEMSLPDCPEYLHLSYQAVHKPRHTAPYGHTMEPETDIEKVLTMLAALSRDIMALVEVAGEKGYRVMLWSDNGTAADIGGGKGTLYEDGIRTPLLLWNWGATAVTDESLVSVVDLLTLMDGKRLGDSETPGQRQYLYAEKFPGATPDLASWDWAIRDQDFKLHRVSPEHSETGEEEYLLFNLESHAGEGLDVAAEFPAEVARLKAEAVLLQGQ